MYIMGLVTNLFAVNFKVVFMSNTEPEERHLKNEYERLVFGWGRRSSEKAKAALDRAHENRRLEIGLLWQRAVYAASFQGVLFAAWGTLSVSDATPSTESVILQVIIIVAGILFAFLWICINYGSKFWQENWEHHVEILEREFEGNLHKVVFLREEDNKFLPTFGVPFSVSHISTIFSWGFFLMWVIASFLLSVKTILYSTAWCMKNFGICFGLILSAYLMLIILVCYMFNSRWLKTRLTNKKKIILGDAD